MKRYGISQIRSQFMAHRTRPRQHTGTGPTCTKPFRMWNILCILHETTWCHQCSTHWSLMQMNKMATEGHIWTSYLATRHHCMCEWTGGKWKLLNENIRARFLQSMVSVNQRPWDSYNSVEHALNSIMSEKSANECTQKFWAQYPDWFVWKCW